MKLEQLRQIIREELPKTSWNEDVNLPISQIKTSIISLEKWINTNLDSTNIPPNQSGNQVLDVKEDIDYAILLRDNKYLFKVEKKDFKDFKLIKRENGKEEIYAYLKKDRMYGTFSISKEYRPNEFTNGIVTLSYKGKQIGDVKLSSNQDDEIDKEDIEYAIFVEGPTFTNSQGGGHGFYDWDIEKMIKTGGNKDHKVMEKNGKVIMITEFEPSDYVDKESFEKYWKKNSKNNEIKKEEDREWSVTLKNKDGKWFLIDQIDKDVLDSIY
jgi:hypothetical protein